MAEKENQQMENSGKTEMVFILDRSGSMSGLESDTIGGFNSMIEKQKKVPGEAIVTTVLFDDKIETIHDRLGISKIPTLTDKEYYPRGCTALLDAIGMTIQRIADVQCRDENTPVNTMFVITTDGLENASREYNYNRVKTLIEEKKKVGWEFVFLGANIDAVAEAEKMGISAKYAINYNCDDEGIKKNYDCVEKMCCSMRYDGIISDSCRDEIDLDYRIRGKGKKKH